MDEQFAIEVMSGRRRGAVAAGLRCVCAIASQGYGAAIRARNRAYDRGWLRSCASDVPVISLGNITTGGTGKTPVTAFLARKLRDWGLRPSIVSRGYRQLNDEANDERLVLEQLVPDVPQVMNRDRVAGARTAVEVHASDVVLLDDGFQHRRLKRDLDLVLIDATRPWGFGRLLPRGLLREPLSELRRADAVVITRCDQVSCEELELIRAELVRWRETPEAVEVRFVPRRLRNAAGEVAALDQLGEQRCLPFCGIGNPEGFRRMLRQLRVDSEPVSFPDHHHYGSSDLELLARLADDRQASILVTTQKDLVKLPQRELAGRPVWAVEIQTDVVSGGQLLEQTISRVVDVSRRAA